MASNSTQSFIVTGLDSFEREIDLADDRAHEKITTLTKKFRDLFKEMHDRVDELAASASARRTE